MNKYSEINQGFQRSLKLVQNAYKELPVPIITLALKAAESQNARSQIAYAKSVLKVWVEERRVPEDLITAGRNDQWQMRRQFCLWARRLKDHSHVCEYCTLDFPRHGLKKEELPKPAQVAIANL